MGWMYARFVAVSVAILGGVMFFGNVANPGFQIWVWIWVLVSGLLGMAGGVGFMLTIDGPDRFRQKWVRAVSWAAMLVAVALPTSLTLMLAPLTFVLIVALFVGWGHPDKEDEPVTSA